MKKNIVIKIGGSLLFHDNEINSKRISDFCEILLSARSKYDHIIIICGGGSIARQYINAVRSFGGNEALCDTFGIDVSRLNSRLYISKLASNAFPQVPHSVEELSLALQFKKIIVMGGLQPGQSTTTVAVEVAEYINAQELVILTDVDGIYDKDPHKYADARLLKTLNYDELQSLFIENTDATQAAAGEYRIIDAVSLQLLKRSRIQVFLTSGKNLEGLTKYLNDDNKTKGTTISNQ